MIQTGSYNVGPKVWKGAVGVYTDDSSQFGDLAKKSHSDGGGQRVREALHLGLTYQAMDVRTDLYLVLILA